jgi:hypothetical protein
MNELPIEHPAGKGLMALTSWYDQIFWFGDLNYRIKGERGPVEAMVKEGKFDEAMKLDELMLEMQDKRIFVGFEESAINFPPTYKYDTDVKLALSRKSYDTPLKSTFNSAAEAKLSKMNMNVFDSSSKQRVPSWCDRILFSQRKSNHLMHSSKARTHCINEGYGSCMDIHASDHKPVYGFFSIVSPVGNV